jgi:hypothetical protein
MGEVDLLAVVVATVASFLFGSLWYSPLLLLGAWQKAAGREPRATPQALAVAFVATALSALGLAWLLGPAPTFVAGVADGLAVGLSVVAASFAINYQFAGREPALLAIDGGFHVLRFAVMGAILGLWP